MKLYWDTSAAINAIVSKDVWDRLHTDVILTRNTQDFQALASALRVEWP